MPDDFTITFVGGVMDGRVEQRQIRGRALVIPVACRAKSSPYDWGQQEYTWTALDIDKRTVTARLAKDNADIHSDDPILCRVCGGEKHAFVVSANLNPCVCMLNYILSGSMDDA